MVRKLISGTLVAALMASAAVGAPVKPTATTVGVGLPLVLLQFGALTGHLSPPPPHETSKARSASTAKNSVRGEAKDGDGIPGLFLGETTGGAVGCTRIGSYVVATEGVKSEIRSA